MIILSLTSSLLKICSLYTLCYRLCPVAHVEPDICVEVRGDWRVTVIYTTSVNCYKCHRFYLLSQFTWKYNGLLINPFDTSHRAKIEAKISQTEGGHIDVQSLPCYCKFRNSPTTHVCLPSNLSSVPQLPPGGC